MWLFPITFALSQGFWRFPLVWLAWSVITGYVIFLATRRPLAQSTPRLVYSWFVASYRICYYAACTGYVVLMMMFFGLVHLIHILGVPEGFESQILLLMLYGLYFGVLGRDCAEMCCDSMAASLGLSVRDDSLPSASKASQDSCGICAEKFPQAGGNVENVVILKCNHHFHEFCLRGWAIVGKKDMCPYCREKVDIKGLFSSPWDMQSIWWAFLLDACRYLIVWNPIILFLVSSGVHLMGGHHHEDDAAVASA
eukprot:Rmarinus@m.16967